MPSPEWLYTQKVRVAVGTREKSVSKVTVSAENVSVFAVDAENESSSVHALSVASRASNMMVMYLFISLITDFIYNYYMP